MPSSHHNVFEELKKVTCREPGANEKLLEILTTKLELIGPGSLQAVAGHEELQELARLFLQIIQDVMRDRYHPLSIRCFAHLCVALDYLMDPEDTIRDADPKGYEDDRAFLIRTAERFKPELMAYKAWKTRTGARW